MNRVFHLHLHLLYIEPTIWRKVQVPATFDLSNLHVLIQFLMSWQNGHLAEFEAKDGQRYSPFADTLNEDMWDDETAEVIDAELMELHEVFSRVGSTLLYRYDFGDNWEVVIKLEKITEARIDINYPYLVGGEMAGPPEDCGGAPGYENLVQIMADPHHPEYQSIQEWIGGEFDPKEFDIELAREQMDMISSGEAEIVGQLIELMPEGWENMDPEEFERIATPLMEQLRQSRKLADSEAMDIPAPDFDGLEQRAFESLTLEPFEDEHTLFQFDLPEELLEQSPMFHLMRLILNHLAQQGPIKLTATGNLPVKICKAFYEQVWSIEELTKAYYKKPRIETDYENLFTGRHTLQLAGLTKIRTGKLSLTKKGEKLLAQARHQELFQLCFQAFCEKFNWGCFDGYGENQIGQMGFAFTFYLLKRYGDEGLPPDFYAEKYINAFSHFLLYPPLDMFDRPMEQEGIQRAFITRNFYRNLPAWGFVEIIGRSHRFDENYTLKKTALLDALTKA